MRGILGVTLAAGLLVGCGGVEEAPLEQDEVAVQTPTTAPEGTVEAMWGPDTPGCFEYHGTACSREGARFDCWYAPYEPGRCLCYDGYWHC